MLSTVELLTVPANADGTLLPSGLTAGHRPTGQTRHRRSAFSDRSTAGPAYQSGGCNWVAHPAGERHGKEIVGGVQVEPAGEFDQVADRLVEQAPCPMSAL
jgi:hypothetical protein